MPSHDQTNVVHRDVASQWINQETDLNSKFGESLIKARDLAKTCRADAMMATERKRRGRWLTGIVGVLTAIGGAVSVILPPNSANIYKYLGVGGTIAGSIIATAGQYIDPVRSKQRTVDLQKLGINLENMANKNAVEFQILTNNNLDEKALQNCYVNFVDELEKLEREVKDLGVGV